MKKRHLNPVLIACILSTALSLASFAQDADEPSLDEAFAALRTCRQNESRAALRVIQDHVIASLEDQDESARLLMEGRLVGILQSPDATADAKAWICRQLLIIGTDQSVPALAALLSDESLSHMARYALERIPDQAAFDALADALDQNAGELRAGIEYSLKRKHDRVAALAAKGSASDVPYLLSLAASGNDIARDGLARMRAERVDAVLADQLADSQPQTRALIARLLGERGAAEYQSALRDLASDDESSTVRVAASLALADLVRADQLDERITLLEGALKMAESEPDRNAVLDEIAETPSPSALRLATETLQADDGTPLAAAEAILSIATAIADDSPDEARKAVSLVRATFTKNEDLQRRCGELIGQIERNADLITEWVIAGPYPKDEIGEYSVFEYEFPPEVRSHLVEWLEVPADAIDPPGVVDLKRVQRGKDCAAYLITLVISESDQPARLEIGSDDGVKAWINYELVHANDVMRPHTLHEDHADIELHKGENVLLLKVTQGAGDWKVSCRVRAPDGVRLDGVTTQRPVVE